MIIHHIPVFRESIVQLLQLKHNTIFFDCTCGEGGHASIILPYIPKGHYFGFDRDADALAVADRRLMKIAPNFTLIPSNYAEIPNLIQAKKIPHPTVLFADLGLSMFQLKTTQRGFSFLSEDPLLMRYDSDQSQRNAFDIINHYPEKKLADIIYEYGEERASRKIAGFIVKARRKKPIETCSELATIVAKAKGYRHHGRSTHPATQTFQALRIETNQEMIHLESLLNSMPNIMLPQGLVAFISYHSIEDRKIKFFFRDSSYFERWNKKVIKPSDDEIKNNPAARSAKLRIGIRNEHSIA